MLYGTRKKYKVVRFGKDTNAPLEVKGQAIEIVIPDTGEVMAIFFTNEHAGYWLEHAGPSPAS